MVHRLSVFLFLAFISLIPFHPVEDHALAGEDAFPLLPGLESSVEFWKLVFTKYGRSELIFYDSINPTKIYKVVEAGKRRVVRRLIRVERRKIKRRYGLKSSDRVRVQRGVKERFVLGLEHSRRYLEQMQRIFEERGLPIELAYLPLIESSFQIDAYSHAGAVGIWQFMRSTGRRFLHITSRVDERKDPLESTRAAASLLEENYDLFGSWPLAITAYNHGERGILRAIDQVGSSDLMAIIRHYKSRTFGISSKNFYAEFLAALEVASKVEDYFPDIEYHSPIPIEEMELEQPISVSSLIKSTGVSRQEFLSWNPALSRKIKFLPKWYRVKVPAENLEAFAAAYQKIVNRPWIRHLVTKGETLSHIARNYRISVYEIQNVNGLLNIHFISIGQLLKIPTH
ncbi:MAG: transglycosylase SLT domain-containing protein [Deltaproteobacteria bacterium]|nr:transglycosylase SLT domain-containing protein [Deltaproteobacteria bacterium]